MTAHHFPEEAGNSCKHERIQTWRDMETGEPAGLWGCAHCMTKFVPITELAAQSRELHQHKKYLYDIYHWIDSTCPQGFADEAIRCIPEEARDFIFAEKASEGYTPRKPDVDSRQYQSSETRSKLVPPGDAQLMLYQSRELASLRAKVGMLEAKHADAIGYLKDIGDWAHSRSSGPTVPDDMWEVRRMAYEGMDNAAIERSKG